MTNPLSNIETWWDKVRAKISFHDNIHTLSWDELSLLDRTDLSAMYLLARDDTWPLNLLDAYAAGKYPALMKQ